MSFDQLWELTSTISSETAFSYSEAQALYHVLLDLPSTGSIVEVGCEFGRSTSLLAQMAKIKNRNLCLVDPFPSSEAASSCVAVLRGIGHPFTLLCMKTEEILSYHLPPAISLVHIDGDHETEPLTLDCLRLLPRVVPGGYAAFHDYGWESLPTVFPVVDRFMNANWRQVILVGTLGIWQKK